MTRDQATGDEFDNLEDALVVAGFLNSFIRHADVLKIANLAQIVNVIAPLLTKDDDLKFIIIDGQGINQLDSTGEEVLYHLTERLHSAGVELLVARMKKQFMDTLRRTGRIAKLREEHFFARVQEAIDYAFERLGPELVADSPLRLPGKRANEAAP